MSKQIVYTLLLGFCFIVVLIFYPKSDGLIVSMSIEKNNTKYKNIYYIHESQFKVVTDKNTIIFSEDHLSIINHETREYWSGSIKQFNNQILKKKLNNGTRYLSKVNLYSQDKNRQGRTLLKAQTDRFNKSIKDEKVVCELFKTPNYTSIADYACRKYEIRSNDQLVEEVWIAENLKYYLNYDLNLDLYHDFMGSLLQHTGSRLYLHLESFMEVVENGFPMRIVMYGKNPPTTTQVESLLKRNLDESTFIIPATYSPTTLKSILR